VRSDFGACLIENVYKFEQLTISSSARVTAATDWQSFFFFNKSIGSLSTSFLLSGSSTVYPIPKVLFFAL